MARNFAKASSEQIILAMGGMNFVFGPATLAAIVRINTLSGSNVAIFGVGTVTVGWNLVIRTSGLFRFMTDGVTVDSTTGLVINNWYLLAVSKATGTVTPRFHIYNYTTGAWVHETTSSIGNGTVPVSAPRIGSQNGAITFDGSIAVVGAWNVVLADTQIESLVGSLSPWFQVQPKGLWVLDQGAVTMLVPDLSGGGANETSKTGTTVSPVSVPIWTPGQGAMAA